jgi:RhoGEF domain
MNSIQEFISSEETYVKNLITVVDVFARPLRSYSQDRMNSILKPFNCTKIFLNIDQILSVNEGFLEDLRKYQKNPEAASFGAICDAHVRLKLYGVIPSRANFLYFQSYLFSFLPPRLPTLTATPDIYMNIELLELFIQRSTRSTKAIEAF